VRGFILLGRGIKSACSLRGDAFQAPLTWLGKLHDLPCTLNVCRNNLQLTLPHIYLLFRGPSPHREPNPFTSHPVRDNSQIRHHLHILHRGLEELQRRSLLPARPIVQIVLAEQARQHQVQLLIGQFFL
jgi:hypothetical protein